QPVRGIGDQLGGVALLHVLGEHQQLDPGVLLTDQGGRPHALVGEGRWHAHIDHRQVRLVGRDRAQQGGAVAHRGDHLVARLGQQAFQACAQQHGVVGDHDPHRAVSWGSGREASAGAVVSCAAGATGISCTVAAPAPGRGSSGITAISTVPPPGGLATSRWPPVARTRSVRPARPVESPPRLTAAPPRPSSSIRTRSAWSVWVTVTEALVASECLAMLVKASETTKEATASGSRPSPELISTRRSTGTGERAATADSAASRPRSVRTAGWMPRTSCRRSVITAFASLCASPTMALARWGSLWIVFLAMPRVIAR